MSDKKITDLPIGADCDGSEFVPIVQGGTTSRVTVRQALAAAAAPWFSSTIGFQQPDVGTVPTTAAEKFFERLSVDHDFGAVGDGSSDDSAAFTHAAASGRPVFLTPGKTYVTGPILPPSNGMMCLFSEGVGATIRLKPGSSDHLIKNTTKATVWLSNVSLDGNRGQNNALPINPGVVFNQIGTLVMFGGTVSGGVHDHILSGNVDYSFDASQKAELVYLNGVTVNAGVSTDRSADNQAPQDAIRIFRTKIVRLINVHTIGGLSGARMGWYNEDVQVLGGTFEQSWADCGITVYMTDRFTIDGPVCKYNFNNGIEVDAANNGTVRAVCTDNGKNGILLTEYGPPTSSPSFAGTYDGVTTSYPNVYPCRGVMISGCTVRHNGMAGIKCLGQGTGVSIKGNHIEDNGTSGTVNENCGLFIGGATLNDDAISFGGNTFVNINNQSFSVRKSNNVWNTWSDGNTHIGGSHFEFAIKGYRTSLARGALADITKWGGTFGTLQPDANSLPPKFARVINDASSSGSVTGYCTIPCSPAGEKIVQVHLRTPDTMTSVTLAVDLYANGAQVHTVYNQAVTLTSTYIERLIDVPDSLSSYNYDAIIITFTTGTGQVGNLNIGLMDVFGNWEF